MCRCRFCFSFVFQSFITQYLVLVMHWFELLPSVLCMTLWRQKERGELKPAKEGNSSQRRKKESVLSFLCSGPSKILLFLLMAIFGYDLWAPYDPLCSHYSGWELVECCVNLFTFYEDISSLLNTKNYGKG